MPGDVVRTGSDGGRGAARGHERRSRSSVIHFLSLFFFTYHDFCVCSVSRKVDRGRQRSTEVLDGHVSRDIGVVLLRVVAWLPHDYTISADKATAQDVEEFKTCATIIQFYHLVDACQSNTNDVGADWWLLKGSIYCSNAGSGCRVFVTTAVHYL